MRISISHQLRPSFDGMFIETAPSVPQLHAILGPPSRVDSGPTPAPVGHRNIQVHIYDSLGICFFEHHYTRRLSGCEIVVRMDSRWTGARRAAAQFGGTLEIAGHAISSHTDLRTFFRTCPVKFVPTMLGWLQAAQDGFSVIIALEGAPLPSGRRSQKLQLVTVELSWPHYPWGDPAID